MTTPRETRANAVRLELRSDGSAERVAAGYAAIFNVEADIGGGLWLEKFMPGAFANSLRSRDVLAVHSHDNGRVVGRMGAGTLDVREDDKGLAFENRLPDTTDGRDLAVQLERGDIAGMSFAFIARREEWNWDVEPPRRTIYEADLFEITYTADPAYPDTEVGLRSLEAARTDRAKHNRSAALSRIAERRARQAQLERGIR